MNKNRVIGGGEQPPSDISCTRRVIVSTQYQQAQILF
jgi:hypothetical protein